MEDSEMNAAEEIDGSDMNQQWCQSCGMPMGYTEKWLGTNADGTKNPEYCSYCWKDGAFAAPEMTMDEMIEICIPYMVANPKMGFTEESARKLMYEMLPHLKRWKKDGE